MGYVSLTTGNVLDMYKAIAGELGLPTERSRATAYLAHRLRLAGCELPRFDPPAVEALAHSARGLPRRINRIAHYALTAAATGARTVTAVHLEHAVADAPNFPCAGLTGGRTRSVHVARTA